MSLENAIAKIDEKLEDPEMPAHAFARLIASRVQLVKLQAQQGGGEEQAPDDLGPALGSMPVEHASEILVTEIRRLRADADGYYAQLAELVGEDEARRALEAA